MKNLCGISFLKEVDEYGDFNLRQFQDEHATQEESNRIASHSASSKSRGEAKGDRGDDTAARGDSDDDDDDDDDVSEEN